MTSFTYVFLLFFINNIVVAIVTTSVNALFLRKQFTLLKDKWCQVDLEPVWRNNETFVDCAL